MIFLMTSQIWGGMGGLVVVVGCGLGGLQGEGVRVGVRWRAGGTWRNILSLPEPLLPI